MNKYSLGCGCRNVIGGRKQKPWICRETGQRAFNTKDLADLKSVTYHNLIRALRKGQEFIDSDGNHWKALTEESVDHFRSTDSFEALLQGEMDSSLLAKATDIYIYTVPRIKNWFKIGISNNTEKRSRNKSSRGIYGELVSAWTLADRRSALLVEAALLRDTALEKPGHELMDLSHLSGHTEIRKADQSQLILRTANLINELQASENWVEWALSNIPELNKWEINRLEALSCAA